MNRIVGIETEYGCLTHDHPGTPSTVTRVRDWIFADDRYGLIDVHQRDWDEPSGNGGFLFNGGRAYVDMGHLEYCTPECQQLLDVLRYDRAGDAILVRALKEMRFGQENSFIRNNVDHYSGATFGCHENYLVRRSAPLTESNVQSLLTFLTLRLLYTSSGRVGSTFSPENRSAPAQAPGVDIFQISQRADYINNDLFEWVQFNRAIINTRDEPLADPRRFRRLHLLHGDSNVLSTTLLLKVGTTALVLDLLESDRLPKCILSDAVQSFHALSHQLDGPWLVRLDNGVMTDAIEILSRYQQAAHDAFAGRDKETDDLLRSWRQTLSSLASKPEALVGKIDWITKRFLFEQFMAQEGIGWNSPWLKSQDLEFHQLDRRKSLGLAMDQPPASWEMAEADILSATMEPPMDTRACARSKAMERLKESGQSYFIDWELLGVEGGDALQLMDPFEPAPVELERWIAGLDAGGRISA